MQDALENEFPAPWETEAAFTRILLVNAAPNGKCTLHRPDLWHTVNLGIGKTFVGGAVSVLEKAFSGRNRALRYERLNSDYSAFCRSNHLQLKDRITPHVTNFFRLRLTVEKQEGKRKYKSDGAVMVGEFVCMYVCSCTVSE